MLSLLRSKLPFHLKVPRILTATRGLSLTPSTNRQNQPHSGGTNRTFTRNFISGDESNKKDVIPTKSTSNMNSALESGTINVVKVPNMGKNLKRCKIYKWFKKPGDYVNVDDLLCILETDLIFGKVYSQVAGTVIENVNHEGVFGSNNVNLGSTVSVGSDLAVLVNDEVIPNPFQDSKAGGFAADGRRHFSTAKYRPMISFTKLKFLEGKDASGRLTSTMPMGAAKLVGADRAAEPAKGPEPQSQTQGGSSKSKRPPYVLDDFYKSPFRTWFRLVSEEEINLVNHGTIDPK